MKRLCTVALLFCLLFVQAVVVQAASPTVTGETVQVAAGSIGLQREYSLNSEVET